MNTIEMNVTSYILFEIKTEIWYPNEHIRYKMKSHNLFSKLLINMTRKQWYTKTKIDIWIYLRLRGNSMLNEWLYKLGSACETSSSTKSSSKLLDNPFLIISLVLIALPSNSLILLLSPASAVRYTCSKAWNRQFINQDIENRTV